MKEKVIDGEVKELSGPQNFDVKPLRSRVLEGAPYEAMKAYRKQMEESSRITWQHQQNWIKA